MTTVNDRYTDLPMRMHKSVVIRALHQAKGPEDVRAMVPDYDDADAAIEALEQHPGEWIVRGTLLTPEEWAKVKHLYRD